MFKYEVFSGPYFPVFGLNTGNWKIRTRKISVFGHFSRSDHCQSQMIQTQQTVVLWNWRYTLPVFKNSLNSACCFKKNYGCCSNNSTDRVVITFPLESIVILPISHGIYNNCYTFCLESNYNLIDCVTFFVTQYLIVKVWLRLIIVRIISCQH